MRTALLCVALLVALLPSTPVIAAPVAADKALAKDAYRRGTHAYNFGEYQTALDAFKEAYSAYEEPTFLFNIAQCHRQLGHTEEAISVYKSYLRTAQKPANADEVKAIVAKLEHTLEEEKAKHAVEAAPVVTPAPAPVIAPTPAPTPVTVELATAPPPPAKKPLVKKAWFWGAIGAGVVVVGGAIALGVVFGTHEKNPSPSLGAVNGN